MASHILIRIKGSSSLQSGLSRGGINKLNWAGSNDGGASKFKLSCWFSRGFHVFNNFCWFFASVRCSCSVLVVKLGKYLQPGVQQQQQHSAAATLNTAASSCSSLFCTKQLLSPHPTSATDTAGASFQTRQILVSICDQITAAHMAMCLSGLEIVLFKPSVMHFLLGSCATSAD